MAVLVDQAIWRWRGKGRRADGEPPGAPPSDPRAGTRWGHLVSDTSLEELHAFAARLGLPHRSFDSDHYDVPAEIRRRAIELGAEPVTSRELLVRLRAAGLRRPRRQAGCA